MQVVSIGFQRDDGDFQVLATLNNNDEHMTQESFASLVNVTKNVLGTLMMDDTEIVVLERQDAPDYVTLYNDNGEAVDATGAVL